MQNLERQAKRKVQNFILAALACDEYSPAMSTATLQQLGQSLPSWLALVQRGETVAIMDDGGHEVARLVPPKKSAIAESASAQPAARPRRE